MTEPQSAREVLVTKTKRFLGLGKSSRPFLRGFKNATVLSLGNLGSQAIGFVGSLFIARLFGREKLGDYATVLAFVTFFQVFDLTGLVKPTIREGCKSQAALEQTLSSTVFLRSLSMALAVVLCIAASFLSSYSQTIKLFIVIFSLEIVFVGLDSFLSAIYQTVEKMQYLAVFNILTRLLATVFSIVLLYLGGGVLAIVLVNLFSKGAVLLFNFFCSRQFARFRFVFRLKIGPRIFRPAIVFTLMGLLTTLAIKIDVLMLSFLSGRADVGLYSVANSMGQEGILFRNIAAVAFFPIAVKFFQSRSARARMFLRYAVILFLIVLAGAVVISLFAPQIMVLFYGAEFAASGAILRRLVFYLPLAFFALPFTAALQATHNERLLLGILVMAAAVNITLNIVFFKIFGLIGIAYSTIVVYLFQAAALSIVTVRRLRRQGYFV